MKICVLLLLIGLVLSDKILSQKIDKVLQTQLGQTLLNTAQLALQTSAPLDRLIDTLEELEDRYQHDQKEDDQENREFQSQCDKDLSDLETEIDSINRQKVKLQGAIDQLKSAIDSKKKILDEKNKLRNNLRKGMNEIDIIREYQEDMYEQNRGEVGKIIKTLEEVKLVYATKLRTNFMELQTEKTNVQKSIFLEINDHLNSIKKLTKLGKPFQKIIEFMIQMSQNGNNIGVLRNIIDLSDQLIKEIDEVWQIERKAEQERVSWYQEYQKFMNTDFKKFDQVINELEVQLQTLKERLTDFQNKLDNLLQRLESKEYNKQDRRSDCQEAANDYTQRRNSRQEDRNTVSEVLGIVNVNMRDLKETLAAKMAAGDNI